MTSQISINSDAETSAKLPALREGQNSLVFQGHLPAPPTPKDHASEWAKDIRTR